MLTVHSLATGTIATHVPVIAPLGISQVEPTTQKRPQHGWPAIPQAGRASAASLALMEPESVSPLSTRTPVSLTDESMDELDPSIALLPLSTLDPLSVLALESLAFESLSTAESAVDIEPSALLAASGVALASAPPSLSETQRARAPLVSQRSLAAHAGLQLETHVPATHVNPSRQLGTHAVGVGGLHASSDEEPKSSAKDQARMDRGIIAPTITESLCEDNCTAWVPRGILFAH